MQTAKNADFLPASLVDSFFQSDYFYSRCPSRARKALPKEPAAAGFTNRPVPSHFLFNVKSLSTSSQLSKHALSLPFKWPHYKARGRTECLLWKKFEANFFQGGLGFYETPVDWHQGRDRGLLPGRALAKLRTLPQPVSAVTGPRSQSWAAAAPGRKDHLPTPIPPDSEL